MLFGVGDVQQAGGDLLMGGRAGVAQEPLGGQTERRRPGGQRLLQRLFDAAPGRALGLSLGLVVAGAAGPVGVARLQQVERGGTRVVVAPVPLVERGRRLGVGDAGADRLELVGRHLGRRRPPPVAVAEQHDEVGPRRGRLAARQLREADPHRLLVEGGLVAHAPAQVDRLEAGVVLGAQLVQAREDVGLQGVALGGHVLERRADEDAEGAGRAWHGC